MRSLLQLGLAFIVGLFSISPRLLADKGKEKKAVVIVYDGWGTPAGFRLQGRVLEEQPGPAPKRDTLPGANLIENLKALESDEVAGANVSVAIAGRTFSATSDGDGMFEVFVKNLPEAERLAIGGTPVTVTITGPAPWVGDGKGKVYVHPDIDSIGLISDIDDTVLSTFVTDKRRMMAEVMLKNATQLDAVPGAPKAYQATNAAGLYAWFYVSGSPQNLYVRLRKFLDDNGYPGGPIVLKNLGDDKLFAHDEYKLGRIEKILAAFPKMKFILVGDSGERDPEIYRTIRTRHPERVHAVVIRKVPGSKHLEPERFAGFTVVDDVFGGDVLVGLLPRPLPPVAAVAPAPAPGQQP